jgi:hypothetical protein
VATSGGGAFGRVYERLVDAAPPKRKEPGISEVFLVGLLCGGWEAENTMMTHGIALL